MVKRAGLGVALLALLAAWACGGSNGSNGTNGENGEAGATGTNGNNGTNGTNGTNGAAGEAGAMGAMGAAGEAGATGATGAAGEAGAQGPAGEAGAPGTPGKVDPAGAFATASTVAHGKLKHLVVIFNENISYDHYFGTYPMAANDAGGVPFHAMANTPANNNLATPLDMTQPSWPGIDAGTGALLANNPTAANALNGTNAIDPFRLDYTQAGTADMGHNYLPEQLASNGGAMDLFPLYTGTAGPPPGTADASAAPFNTKGLVMGYYDGNTLGLLWSLAQNYSMNDNSWTTVFGPSTPGAINLVSGQTDGVIQMNHTPFSASHATPNGNGGWTMIGDTDPLGDVCSTAADQNLMSGKNIGDLLNASNPPISWGFFEGGFDLTLTNANGTTGCKRITSPTVTPFAFSVPDYIPHHQPFQYYASTSNPNHWRPSSVTAIGNTKEDDGATVDPANHQYDSHDFFDALHAGNFPAVSFLKAPAYQDGHAGYSDPVDEQAFINQVVTAVQSSGFWDSTAIVIAYDDSDGWYDHQAPPIVNMSASPADALNGAGVDGGAGLCNSGGGKGQQNGDGGAATGTLLGAPPADGGAAQPAQGRCGYGTRLPLLVVSPLAKKNFIDHTLTDQSSVLRLIEDNWLAGERIQPGGSFDTIAGTMTNMFN
jgi:phospholipase C